MVAERAFNRISTHRREQLSLPKKGRKKTIKLPVFMPESLVRKTKITLSDRQSDYKIMLLPEAIKFIK
jgi:hypothetical protein